MLNQQIFALFTQFELVWMWHNVVGTLSARWVSRTEHSLHLFHFSIVRFSTLLFQKAACLIEKSLHGGEGGGTVCLQTVHCTQRKEILWVNKERDKYRGVLGCYVAGQHFSVTVTQLFYIRGFWANVHCKLKLSIKVQPCVLGLL